MAENKKRGSNYLVSEKGVVLNLIKKYLNIIESKEINNFMIDKKKEAWIKITEEYNAVAVSGVRTWQQLRHLYGNLKQKTKRNNAKKNKEINGTGGGPRKQTTGTEHDAQILAMIAPQKQPLPNPFDDEPTYFGDEEVIEETVATIKQENDDDFIVIIEECVTDVSQHELLTSTNTEADIITDSDRQGEHSKRPRPKEITTSRGDSKRVKKDRQSYADAVQADLMVAITSQKSYSISEVNANLIQTQLTDMMFNDSALGEDTDPYPVFQEKPAFVEGSLRLWCADLFTKTWLEKAIDKVTLPNDEKAKVRSVKDIPKLVCCGILLPGTPGAPGQPLRVETSMNKVGRVLKRQNGWASVDRWVLYKYLIQENAAFVIVGIPEEIIPTLMQRGRKLGYLLGSVYVKFEAGKGRFISTPPEKRVAEAHSSQAQTATEMTAEPNTDSDSDDNTKTQTPTHSGLQAMDTVLDPYSDNDSIVLGSEAELGSDAEWQGKLLLDEEETTSQTHGNVTSS